MGLGTLSGSCSTKAPEDTSLIWDTLRASAWLLHGATSMLHLVGCQLPTQLIQHAHLDSGVCPSAATAGLLQLEPLRCQSLYIGRTKGLKESQLPTETLQPMLTNPQSLRILGT